MNRYIVALLAPVLRDSLRLHGAEILKRVAFDPADAPDYFRYRAGIKAPEDSISLDEE